LALTKIFSRYTLGGMSARKSRRGRPPKGSGQTKDMAILLRLGAQEKAAFKSAAELAGLDVSAWMRERLRSQARKELEGAGRNVAFLQT
jgi:hypothetical protein